MRQVNSPEGHLAGERIGSVEALYICLEGGQAMLRLEEAQLVAGNEGAGLYDRQRHAADRYASGKGRHSLPADVSVRPVTLFTREAIEDYWTTEYLNVSPEAVRGNILTRGVKDLQQLVGRQLCIGAAVVSVEGKIERCRTAPPSLENYILSSGVWASVLVGGGVANGDDIRLGY